MEISSNHCKALRALRPCSCRLNGIQPVSRHRDPGTARGRKGMKTQPSGACHKSELSARMLGCRLLVTAPSHPTRIRYPSGHLQRAKSRLDRPHASITVIGPPGAAAAVAQHQLQVARGGCACCSGPAVEVGSASRRAVEAAASAGQPRGKPWLAPWNPERKVRFRMSRKARRPTQILTLF